MAFFFFFFSRRNVPLFQAKAVGSFHSAWVGPWHWGNRQRNDVEDGNPPMPWQLQPPPCFFLKLVLRRAGCIFSKTLKICFVPVLGSNCSLLIHFQSLKWKGSLPACRKHLLLVFPNQALIHNGYGFVSACLIQLTQYKNISKNQLTQIAIAPGKRVASRKPHYNWAWKSSKVKVPSVVTNREQQAPHCACVSGNTTFSLKKEESF